MNASAVYLFPNQPAFITGNIYLAVQGFIGSPKSTDEEESYSGVPRCSLYWYEVGMENSDYFIAYHRKGLVLFDSSKTAWASTSTPFARSS